MAEDGDEHGAVVRRFTTVKIDKSKAVLMAMSQNTSPKTLMAITLKLITMAEKPWNPPCEFRPRQLYRIFVNFSKLVAPVLLSGAN